MIDAARSVIRDRTGSDVTGYVEAVTETAALGWVWQPGSSDRLTVELRLGEQVLAEACAEGMREDLARSGIGDGRHAFSLPIPETMRSRASEMRVFVIHKDNAAIALDTPPSSVAGVDRLADVQRGLDMLVGSQRLIHRNLQAALLQQTPPLTSALADISAAQKGLQESIATFELFAIRLEQALVTREAPVNAVPTHRGLQIVTAISSLALLGSCWALYRTMLG